MNLEDTNTVGWPVAEIQEHVFACHDEIRRLNVIIQLYRDKTESGLFDALNELLGQVEQGAEFHAIVFNSPTAQRAMAQARAILAKVNA